MLTQQLDTAAAVIAAIGGTKAATKITGRGATTVSNWRVTGRLPSWTYWKIRNELRRLGYDAPAAIWGIPDEPANDDGPLT